MREGLDVELDEGKDMNHDYHFFFSSVPTPEFHRSFQKIASWMKLHLALLNQAPTSSPTSSPTQRPTNQHEEQEAPVQES